ncbi:MAG: hypothetical protein DMG03_25015 [Acidobacteria bacterium]|nr:MAG: hypothetical protein DMG03_25015 [Acidobacteriota bacterium]
MSKAAFSATIRANLTRVASRRRPQRPRSNTPTVVRADPWNAELHICSRRFTIPSAARRGPSKSD